MAGPKLWPLTAAEVEWKEQQLAAARALIDTFSPADAGQPITLAALDRAFAAWLVRGSQDNAEVNGTINAVGIRFGQFLVDEAGFEWIVATDQQGTELAVVALRGIADVLVFPANFVAKRWERKEVNFLAHAVASIKEQVASVAASGGEPPRPWWRFW
jgi:hypothetical protein